MDIESFKQRQAADRERQVNVETVIRRRPFHERYRHLAQQDQSVENDFDSESDSEPVQDDNIQGDDGEEA